MSKPDNLNLINFIAYHMMRQRAAGPSPLWLCTNYKIRAAIIREVQIEFEKWVLNETIAREKRDKNISIYEEE
jgi:hypothetical protein